MHGYESRFLQTHNLRSIFSLDHYALARADSLARDVPECHRRSFFFAQAASGKMLDAPLNRLKPLNGVRNKVGQGQSRHVLLDVAENITNSTKCILRDRRSFWIQ
jgi:hypothetical protein